VEHRRVRLIWADAGYTGTLATWAARLKMTLQIVAKRDPHAFEVLPRRWVVERTFAWISKHRRTVRDYEHLPASHEAMILWAMIALMTRRLAQPTHLSDTHLQQVGQLGLALAEPLHRSRLRAAGDVDACIRRRAPCLSTCERVALRAPSGR